MPQDPSVFGLKVATAMETFSVGGRTATTGMSHGILRGLWLQPVMLRASEKEMVSFTTIK